MIAPNSDRPDQRVLVVEDLDDARTSMQQVLELSLQLNVDVAEDGAQALNMLQEKPYSVAVTDLRMPKMSGMQLIEEIQKRKIPTTVIVTTGHGSISDAVQAMRQGAYDFLTKPVDPQHLSLLVNRALQERALRDEVVQLRQQLGERFSFRNILSKSPRMVGIFETIGQIADSAVTVLVIGETGTGKEMIAQAVHEVSKPHRPGPLVTVNCAAIPETLLESELFGHEKGAFTGAASQRKGRFEQAHTGTIFLDEIGDMPMNMQVKLLRVLQDRKVERVGGSETIEVDVRLVAATNQPLEKLMADGKFREDLYYRLNVVKIMLPPLRERPEDIPVLVRHFMGKFARGNLPLEIDSAAMEKLLAFHWPGNVRQLENAIERACVTARDGIIKLENLPSDLLSTANSGTGFNVDVERPLPDQLNDIVARVEEQYLRKALQKTRGHVGKCAELSGLSRRSVTDKIAQYGIDKSLFKNGDLDDD